MSKEILLPKVELVSLAKALGSTFIHRQDLVTTKRAAGRHQDLADVENLTAPDEENPE